MAIPEDFKYHPGRYEGTHDGVLIIIELHSVYDLKWRYKRYDTEIPMRSSFRFDTAEQAIEASKTQS